MLGELAVWRRRAGIDEEAPAGVAEPWALQLAGEPSKAAEVWANLGCPYEAALAEKTVDHHVSAILRKLGVRTRGQAAAEAGRLGLLTKDR